MRIGNITDAQNAFSYRDQRFSEDKFIIGVRDERFEYNVRTLIMYDNKNLIDLDEYEFENNLFATKPPFNNPRNIADLPLTRFHHNQLIKIDNGTIVDNVGAENPNLPKIKTFNANINSFDQNSFFEFFEGTINEQKALFTPNSNLIFELIKNVYLEANHSFFVISEEKIIGPFNALKVNEASFNIAKGTAKKFGEYLLSDESFLEFEANRLHRRVYFECNQLDLVYKNEHSFASDDELIKNFENEINGYPELFDENSLLNIKKVLAKASEIKPLDELIKTNKRLENLLAQSGEILSQNINLINLIPDVKKIKDDKTKLEEELFIIKQNYEELSAERNRISNEITNLEEIKKQQLESQKMEFQNEIQLLEEKKKNLEIEVEQNRQELEKKLEHTKIDVAFYERTKAELTNQIEILREDFKEEQKTAQVSLQNLIKSKVHFDFISGRDLSENDRDKPEFQDYKILDKFTPSQYRDFRNELINVLKQCNRNFETHFVDNLLITIFQNKLTIFAGVPGTGKTTLARLISNILTHRDKVREVSVNRGWTSQKDLIGFVNPLTKKFHSSSTDIYDLLYNLNHESQQEETYLNTPMSFIILDEANLSPMEHYWSSFYNLTDSNGILQIKLGNNQTLQYPNNLRFIGTINYDHTTEELSPRVLDRVNIIQLPKIDEATVSNIDVNNLNRIQISFKRCIDFFELDHKNAADIKIDERIEKNYREIKAEFKSLKIFISPRVEIAIKRYISLASKYMSDVNKPLDYSVSQRMLPLINLQGNENKQKLELLKEKLKQNKLEISARLVDDIIGIGSEKGIYEDNFNYFLTLSNV